MIELQDLRFTYAEGGFELNLKNLSVDKGERVCWIGPSGSGKTTLLHLVAGIFHPESGCIKICGTELTTLSEASRRDFRIANLGLVFQDFALLDYLSVLDNVLLPYRISRELRLETATRARAEKLATDMGLSEMLLRRPLQLSQGERQRVAVCRAIIANPKLLLADEPTANLDATSAARVLDALEGYATEQGATLIIVSHDRDVIARFGHATDISEFCEKNLADTDGGGHHA